MAEHTSLKSHFFCPLSHPTNFQATLRWRHNGCDSVSNHQPHDCLLNRLFRRRSKKTSKLRVTGLCVGNSPGTGEFLAQMASYAENVSIWWRHHEYENSLMRQVNNRSLLSYLSVGLCLRCLVHHILSLNTNTFRENPDFVFILIVQFMMSANSQIHFRLAERIRLFCTLHHLIIIIVQTYLKTLNL